jgi:hypothetical protein
MSIMLSILGVLLAAAGIVAIGFGIPINEFNLGNTMIVGGTVAVAAGLILFGLAAAVDQLTQIANALRPRAGARPVHQPAQATEPPVPETVHPVPPSVPAKPAMPAPPRNPVFARKLEERAGEPAPAPAEAEPEVSFSAIERLRSSLGRPDRNAVDSADAEDVPYAAAAPAPAAAPPGPAPARGRGANGAAPPAAADSQKKPALDFLFRSKREPQPEAFDSVWPQRGGQRRSEEQREESGRPTAEAPIDRTFLAETPASAPEEARPAAILKSGVVDGMAYTLYADGSIEAQLPQGTVRFGSIAELRAHIENNS